MFLIDEVAEISKKLYERKFVSAYEGNVSARSASNAFLITRSGVCKGEVTSQDILEMDENGNVVKGSDKISTEYKLHLYIYSKRPEVKAVLHAHPIYASAFAAYGEGLTKHILPEIILTLGKVPLCEYATPSTDELSKSLEPHINYSWAFLLRNHGVVTIGKNLKDAYYKMENLEHAAQIIFLARLLGGEKELHLEKIQELLKLSKDTFSIDQDLRNIF